MRQTINVILIGLFVFPWSPMDAQEENPIRLDQEFWMRYGIEKKVNKKMDMTLQWSRRFDDKRTFVKNTFLELGTDYGITKALKVGFSVRRIDRREGRPDRNRITFSGRFKHKLYKYASMSYRVRIERQWEEGEDQRDRFRSKLLLKSSEYKSLPRPYVSAEYFYSLQGAFDAWSKKRFKLGLSYDFWTNNELSVAFIVQEDLNMKKPQRDEVWSVDYTYSF